ncbi:hypothetical protein QL285_038236 [Trifolium repens]|nr:hypothetical protein QL285_038236 [Trifolium repens]
MIQTQLQSLAPAWSLLQLTCLPKKKLSWSGVRLLSLNESYYLPNGDYTGAVAELRVNPWEGRVCKKIDRCKIKVQISYFDKNSGNNSKLVVDRN